MKSKILFYYFCSACILKLQKGRSKKNGYNRKATSKPAVKHLQQLKEFLQQLPLTKGILY
jgi:hypothetical protein